MTFILTVDVGNTRAKLGIFEIGGAAFPQVRHITAIPLVDVQNLSWQVAEWVAARELDSISGCVVAGSNPPARDQMLETWPWPDDLPRVIRSHRDVGMPVDVDEVSSVGIDRLLTAFAVTHLFSAAHPIIVIDSGTATTINLITSDGTFRGGTILPGLRLSANALYHYTARLPMIDTDQLSDGSESVDAPLPGRNTIDAMKSGLFWGQLGAIREISRRLADSAVRDFQQSTPALHVLTGGGGRQLVAQLPNAVYIDSLTLHGLALLAAKHDVQL